MTENRKTEYLKFINTALLTILTSVMIFFATQIQLLHRKIDKMNVQASTEQVQRVNNSNLILDHEGRIRMLEENMKSHVDDLKSWTEDNFEKRRR